MCLYRREIERVKRRMCHEEKVVSFQAGKSTANSLATVLAAERANNISLAAAIIHLSILNHMEFLL